ncbi:hypothetical protein A3C09_04890 [Candidatus Uhrbacteria bacterium RIFCSPHIGHO2_02_FULL_47_44]|uniref:EfeO-type cupredoxin-like domain-containing protein n=1 Tax=Candidatus Uhrbacteria bacterium RIFCSPLOWO2_02_FULL_48_18 TaxID=1802408 RepID=A0A1F7V6Z3_9BACT|nr:MAG: hypothetical protein A2839_02815 [Candidatus Uhrbacteria bacterium RIFCSPHIGHO2_01_FULL_47_10]OGL71569.1 MAG: hypothetical protein A3C09_04890 [Candidatus Uhrbacteria bacterium RIFCSPHIGHO2_02_FULL_47_44]OGL77585.1 MAG: hypothetical protein A3E97_04890 [Candidatus Uhrbacteria bacterium RIFCSPHIGHO2_12_FULL_47_12]OGL80429.1 MAG: hypothetical protein A3B20_03375 [Candidatus Uhrbacteria bacterium RIFCSPLOWO2_01_FULL_47_17]OGL86289.1 MAG: hypothetical protein A3I41_01855 [Candidatus Uhrbact
MTKALSFTKYLIGMFGIALTFLIVNSAHAATTISLSAVQSGDLIRGQAFSAVYYYGQDGLRYVFPNDKIYFTWYQNFNTVKWMTDDDLAKIQIGGNVTYKPGVKMIKINSDPRVYAVSEKGTLREIASEEIAKSLYGSTWNKKIDDLPDGFFSNYHFGGRIELATQYSPIAEQKVVSINDDKLLFPATIVRISDAGFSTPTIHVLSGRAVRFINDGPSLHSATEWDRIWGSGTMQVGDTYTRYFDVKGTWTYYSIYDAKSKMTGAIIVE